MPVVRIKAKCLADHSLDEIFILIGLVDENMNLKGHEFLGYLHDYDDDLNGGYAVYPFILRKKEKEYFLHYGNTYGIQDESCNITQKIIKVGETFTRVIASENKNTEYVYLIDSVYDINASSING